MGIESPPRGQTNGLGSWHPAMRPGSHQPIDPKSEQESQGEKKLLEIEELAWQHVSTGGPVPSAEPVLSLGGIPSEIKHLTSVDHQEARQALYHAAYAEDERHRKLGRELGSSPVKSFFGLVQ